MFITPTSYQAREFVRGNSLSAQQEMGAAVMAKRSINRRRHLRRVFLACLSTYREVKQNGYSTSCAALYDALGKKGGARNGGSRGAYVRATSSDFIADFELAAIRVLEPFELAYFNLVFVRGREEIDEALQKAWPERRYHKFCNHLAEVMGFALKARGLFPLKAYFRPTFIGNARSWPSGDPDNCF